ncbi:MAG: MlaD family protein [Pseudomonadota bacterium]
MKREALNYSLIGAFVLAVSFGVLAFLGAITGRAGPTDHYYVFYDNVSRLLIGATVTYEGYRIGQVSEITPDAPGGDTRYRVRLDIQQGWRVASDAIAKIQATGLISAVAIDISAGRSARYLIAGDTINSEEQADMFALLSDVAGEVRALSENGLMPVLVNLDERISELSEFRQEEVSPFLKRLDQSLNGTLLPRTNELLENLRSVSSNLRGLSGPDNTEKLNSFLTHIDNAAIQLSDLITRIDGTRKQMGTVLENLDELMDGERASVSATFEHAETSMRALEDAMATVNAHLDTILENTESASRHFGEFARAVRNDPSRIVRRSNVPEVQ